MDSLLPQVFGEVEPVLAGRHNVQVPVSRDVSNGEIDTAAFSAAGGTVVDDLLGEALPCPLEVVDADVIVAALIMTTVRAIPLAGDQLARAIPVEVNPLQVVILSIVRIDGMFDPDAAAISICVAFAVILLLIVGAP